MTVLLVDATANLSPEAKAAYDCADLSDIVYADDTLLLGVSPAFVKEYLQAVFKAGKRYGMELHWDKFQVMPVQMHISIYTPDGVALPSKEEMQYLGAAIAADEDVDHEPSKRIGVAKGEFAVAGKFWSHSSSTWRRKLRMIAMLIESKMLYSLRGGMLDQSPAQALGWLSELLRAQDSRYRALLDLSDIKCG